MSDDPDGTPTPSDPSPEPDGEDPFETLPEADGESPFEVLPEADGEGPPGRPDGEPPGERTPARDEELFERLDTGSTEAPSWETLVSTDGPADGTPGDVDPGTVEERVVPKRKYCQDCVHLAAPPDVACTHDDGEILEVVDTDSFRVRNCPVVAHRRERAIYGDAVADDD